METKKVLNYNKLQKLKKEEGLQVYCLADKKFYICKNSEWHPVEPSVAMSLYEMNKQIISQLDPVNEEEIRNIIQNWYNNNTCEYYLLYGKEVSYFTLLEHNRGNRQEMQILDKCAEEDFTNVIIDCLKNIGEVKSISETENKDALEIWVRWDDEVQETCMYLFDYTKGIVYFN